MGDVDETNNVKTDNPETPTDTVIENKTDNKTVIEPVKEEPATVPEPEKKAEPEPEKKPEPITEPPVKKVIPESTPGIIEVECSGCKKVFDLISNQKICPYCGMVRRGRMPKGATVSSAEPEKNPDGSVKEKPAFTRENAKTKQEPAKKKFTMKDMEIPPSSAELELAGIPVYAVHNVLAKKRGYGLTKDEFEEGKHNFAFIVRKYGHIIEEYMPEMMCAAWCIKVVVMPAVSKEDWEKMKREAANNQGN